MNNPPSIVILMCLILLWSQSLMAETTVGLASWQLGDKEPRLTIRLDDQLSKKQINLINSGFSTYTSLEIILPEGKFTDETTLFKSECTVKYDTWEEHYDISRLGSQTHLEKVKSFKVFSDQCLTASLADHPSLKYFNKNGGQLKATLQLDQISKDRAEDIRDWLIKQQSGVVKGLFAHMLGDLKLSEILRITIQIPPFAQNLRIDPEAEIEVIAIYPGKNKGEEKR
jgi:hypothetical protein